jgi:hypothetical protein
MFKEDREVIRFHPERNELRAPLVFGQNAYKATARPSATATYLKDTPLHAEVKRCLETFSYMDDEAIELMQVVVCKWWKLYSTFISLPVKREGDGARAGSSQELGELLQNANAYNLAYPLETFVREDATVVTEHPLSNQGADVSYRGDDSILFGRLREQGEGRTERSGHGESHTSHETPPRCLQEPAVV